MNAAGMSDERVDAVVVGGRVAGSAAAISLARAGRRVVVLDRASFPSDTLSTHLLFPAGVAELARLGALERVLQHAPPRVHHVELIHRGIAARERFDAVDGIDFGLCLPRPELDLALVRTARAAGAEVRERASVQELLWDEDRVTGLRWKDHAGATHVIRARVVLGADGRRSTVARAVGSDRPYRGSQNGRGFAFVYVDDPRAGDPEWGHVYSQWRARDTHGMVFPIPDGRMVVSWMGPSADITRFRKAPQETWERMLQENRRLADRIAGATNFGRLRTTAELPSYFRASSGPGWALVGDSGHFKDPVLGQGIRDALRYSRIAGEMLAPVVDDQERTDATLRDWEAHRDRECLPAYHWGNRETRIERHTPLVDEALVDFARLGRGNIADAFSRRRNPEHVLSPLRSVAWVARALARPGADRRLILHQARQELAIDVDIRRERLRSAFRETRPATSEREGWAWPPVSAAPAGAERAAGPATTDARKAAAA